MLSHIPSHNMRLTLYGPQLCMYVRMSVCTSVCNYVHCTEHPTDVGLLAMFMCTYGGNIYPGGP